MEYIHIYHTNDLHSHFEHWSRIRNLLLERKKWHEEAGEDVFIFDIGDHMDRWHPFSDATRGKGNTKLLNESYYTAVTIGNNEGITLSHEDLDQMYEGANFDVIVANFFYEDGSIPSWVKPYKIYQTKKDRKIAVIGLTANFAHFYSLLGWRVTDPFFQLKRLITDLKGATDYIIVLSHLGMNEDERIAAEFPEVDVILGAHTHHIFHLGKVVNNTLLGAAGKFGMFVGHITLTIDRGNIIDKQAVLHDTNDLPADQNEKMVTNFMYEEGRNQLSNVIFKLAKKHCPKEELAKLLCHALKEWCHADGAFLNSGLILNDLTNESVTDYDLLTICPHPINPCLINIKGNELKEVLVQSQDPTWPELQIKGFGFRGTIMGEMVYEGIVLIKTRAGTMIKVNGHFLEKDQMYQIAIPDMFTFSHFFPQIHRLKDKVYFYPEFLRDILKWKLINTVQK